MDESQWERSARIRARAMQPEGKFWIYPEHTGEPREGLSEVVVVVGCHMSGLVLGEGSWGGCVAARPAGGSQSSRWPGRPMRWREGWSQRCREVWQLVDWKSEGGDQGNVVSGFSST